MAPSDSRSGAADRAQPFVLAQSRRRAEDQMLFGAVSGGKASEGRVPRIATFPPVIVEVITFVPEPVMFPFPSVKVKAPVIRGPLFCLG
jgi:hypothetical protein